MRGVLRLAGMGFGEATEKVAQRAPREWDATRLGGRGGGENTVTGAGGGGGERARGGGAGGEGDDMLGSKVKA